MAATVHESNEVYTQRRCLVDYEQNANAMHDEIICETPVNNISHIGKAFVQFVCAICGTEHAHFT